MIGNFRNELFAQRVREKRGQSGLRAISDELGIGIATLSRVENGKLPDLPNFGILCQWLGDDPSIFFDLDQPDSDDTLTVQLRAVKAISAETSAAFMDLVRAFYARVLDHTSNDEIA